ncbi:MAG: hypothetical protein KKE20_02755 [Nanoarchaeota archaeon]|nr:hypothetical protein [Nanoarchaeota archaeon]
MSNTEPLARVLVLDNMGTRARFNQLRTFDVDFDLVHNDQTFFQRLASARINQERGYDAFIVNIEGPANTNFARIARYMRSDISIIALADGGSPIKDSESASFYGFDGYLHNPFHTDDAVQAIAMCLEKRTNQYIG